MRITPELRTMSDGYASLRFSMLAFTLECCSKPLRR